MPPDLDLVRGWLGKAHNDLESARRLLGSQEPLLDTGCFHCQQTVEKVLKGYLLAHEIVSPKVHALGLLFDLCEKQDPTFSEIRDDCEWLTRFAVETRYPSGRKVRPERARKALSAAERAMSFVLDRLPPEVRI